MDEFGFGGYDKGSKPELITDKVDILYNMILSFLNNLKKDSETKPTIHWPNRREQIDDFIRKMDSVRNQ